MIIIILNNEIIIIAAVWCYINKLKNTRKLHPTHIPICRFESIVTAAKKFFGYFYLQTDSTKAVEKIEYDFDE